MMRQDSSFNIDINDEDINSTIIDRGSYINSKKRKSGTPQIGEQYATGIYNAGGTLFLEENPTSARLTLNNNFFSRSSNADSQKRKSVILNFGEQYTSGIVNENDISRLFVEENPTSTRATLGLNPGLQKVTVNDRKDEVDFSYNNPTV